MILTPSPLQRPSFSAAATRSLRSNFPGQARPAAMQRPVLQTLRAPQQLCLDLQPRLRQE